MSARRRTNAYTRGDSSRYIAANRSCSLLEPLIPSNGAGHGRSHTAGQTFSASERAPGGTGTGWDTCQRQQKRSSREARLIERVGVRFAERGDAFEGRREVSEILELPPELLRAWSSRRADIETELAALARRFRDEHSRPLTMIEPEQQATFSTRGPKHAPRSEAEQRRS